MKEITYQIQLDKSTQYVYTKNNNVPLINSSLHVDLLFFNNNIALFDEFKNEGGEERVYKVVVYKEFKTGVQRNRAALI